MILHIFNSSVVSGPETLAIPALTHLGQKVAIVFLSEARLGDKCEAPIQYAKDLGHETHSVTVRGRWDRAAFGELRELFDRLGATVVHAHDVKASLYTLKAAQSKPGFKARLVSTHHGTVARKGIIRLYEEIYVRLILPKYEAILAVCEIDRESLLKRGLPANRIFMHPNGVDRKRVDPANRSATQRAIRESWKQKEPRLPAADQATILGVVARLSEEKRHDRMLHALKAARSSLKALNPSAKLPILVAFGIGDQEAKLKELTRELALEDAVFWMGYSKTIGQELAGFDLLLCLSDGEGMPINLIESGWAGTPVLSTRVGGISDLIPVGGEFGFLVEKSDTDESIGKRIAEILSNEGKSVEIGKTFQKRVEKSFSQKAWLDRLVEIYSDISKAKAS